MKKHYFQLLCYAMIQFCGDFFILTTEGDLGDMDFNLELDSSSFDDGAIQYFEHHMVSRGFRMEKSNDGLYVSELTQFAWLGFSLSFLYIQNDDIHSNIDESDTRKNNDIISVINSPSIEANSKDKQILFLSDEREHDADNILPEPVKRLFHKRLYVSKSDALKKATAVSKEKCMPMWVHPSSNEGGWHISSHGFAISRRPDVVVTTSILDERQVFYGFSTSGLAEKIYPSSVARIADSGTVFTQYNEYFSEHLLVEWVREQIDPALVISIESGNREDRSERLTYIQSIIKETTCRTTYYRWITRDTVVIAVSSSEFDYSEARMRVQNPHWILKAMNWPNTFILKERA